MSGRNHSRAGSASSSLPPRRKRPRIGGRGGEISSVIDQRVPIISAPRLADVRTRSVRPRQKAAGGEGYEYSQCVVLKSFRAPTLAPVRNVDRSGERSIADIRETCHTLVT